MSKSIKIDELTRVEGHGGIEIHIKDGVVMDVKFNVFEGPRFFEHAIKSIYYEKIPDITRRICAICTASHSLASIGAIENAFKVKVTPQTEALRDLLINGETIESHALHVFMLALPDYLGFPDAISMSSEYPDAVKAALELKKTGNLIHTALSGREVHGMNDRVGGFSTVPTVDQLNEIKSYLEKVKPTTELAVNLLAGFDLPAYNDSNNFLMAIDSGEHYGYLGDFILTSNGARYPQSEYEKLTNEKVVKHSYAKFSNYKGGSFMVGSLPRLCLNYKKLEGTASDLYKQHKNKILPGNSISNNIAQSIELVQSVDRSLDIIEKLLAEGLKQESLTEFQVFASRGTNAVEAPRGLLYHDYTFDEEGKIVKSNIITPTAQNAANIEKDVKVIADNLKNKPEKEILEAVELMVRAYDPCISCSVHMVHL
jgi:sulfhydrogenase subunit alpha